LVNKRFWNSLIKYFLVVYVTPRSSSVKYLTSSKVNVDVCTFIFFSEAHLSLWITCSANSKNILMHPEVIKVSKYDTKTLFPFDLSFNLLTQLCMKKNGKILFHRFFFSQFVLQKSFTVDRRENVFFSVGNLCVKTNKLLL
jgi:hypothetical protein